MMVMVIHQVKRCLTAVVRHMIIALFVEEAVADWFPVMHNCVRNIIAPIGKVYYIQILHRYTTHSNLGWRLKFSLDGHQRGNDPDFQCINNKETHGASKAIAMGRGAGLAMRNRIKQIDTLAELSVHKGSVLTLKRILKFPWVFREHFLDGRTDRRKERRTDGRTKKNLGKVITSISD